MRCRGIRGAITVEENTREAILKGTRELLQALVEANRIEVEEVAGVFFTTTADLTAEFPAVAAREMGWTRTAFLCGHEIDVPGALAQCIRVMMLYNTEKAPDEIVHVYLKGARNLRKDHFSPKGN